MFDWENAQLVDQFTNIVIYPLYQSSDNYIKVSGEDSERLMEMDHAFEKAIKSCSEEVIELLNTSFWGKGGVDLKMPVPYSRKGFVKDGYFAANSFFPEVSPTLKTERKGVAFMMSRYVQACEEVQYLHKSGKTMQDMMKVAAHDPKVNQVYANFKKSKNDQHNTDFYWNLTKGQRKQLNKFLEGGRKLFPSSLSKMKYCIHDSLEKKEWEIRCKECGLLAYHDKIGGVSLAIVTDLEKTTKDYLEIEYIEENGQFKQAFKRLVETHSYFVSACASLMKLNELTVVVNQTSSNIQLPQNSKKLLGLLRIKKNLDVAASLSLDKIENIPNEVALPLLDFLSQDTTVYDFLASPTDFIQSIEGKVNSLKDELNEHFKHIGQTVQTQQLKEVGLPLERAVEVLKFVESLDGKYGITTLADVLTGSKVKKMYDFKLDKHPHYAYLKDKTREQNLKILNELLMRNIVVKVGNGYPKLHLTEIGKNLLYFSDIPTLTTEEQVEQYLKQSVEEVLESIEYANKEFFDAYMLRNFSDTTPPQYRKMLDRLKDRNDAILFEKMLPYLIKEYRAEYAPIFEFIISTRARGRYGEYIKRIYNVVEKGEAEHVS